MPPLDPLLSLDWPILPSTMQRKRTNYLIDEQAALGPDCVKTKINYHFVQELAIQSRTDEFSLRRQRHERTIISKQSCFYTASARTGQSYLRFKADIRIHASNTSYCFNALHEFLLLPNSAKIGKVRNGADFRHIGSLDRWTASRDTY